MIPPAGPVMHRRTFGAGLMALGLSPAWVQAGTAGTLGYCILDTGTGQVLAAVRADERFAFCSAFKLSLAALVLQRAQMGRLNLGEVIHYDASALMGVSPVTAAHLASGITYAQLAEAVVVYSDNAGANLLLKALGGPLALTRFWRSLGDTVSRLDDIEPALNRVPPGELRNTTTPRAMAQVLAKILTGDVLTAPHRGQLLDWMHASATGLRRIRAGLPADWWAGDKTGTGQPADVAGTYVDLAIIRPPGRAPLIATAFLTANGPQTHIDPVAEHALADVGRIAASLARRPR